MPINIYQEILAALGTEETVMLATVISTSGSTPTSTLSKMLIIENGATSLGTIGGGAVENNVIAEAQRLLPLGIANILTFQLKDHELVQGLNCGGDLDVLIEPINRTHHPLFQQINALNGNRQDCFIGTFLSSDGTVKDKQVFVTPQEAKQWIDGILTNHQADIQHSPTTSRRTDESVFHDLLHRNEIQRIRFPAGEIIMEPVICNPDLFIFGAGHVGKSICQYAAECGFRVVVIDDREEFVNAVRFPKASQTIHHDFLCAFDHITLSSSSYIIIATRGHQYDEKILERALQTPVRYIGMIGSRRKVESIYERLIKNGVSLEKLTQVYAPIGIDIGAVTLEEIAVSIVSQLIRVRRKEHARVTDKSEVMYSFFHKNDVPSY
jgi:xanthine dehydrogenase accessory factor